MVSGKFKSRTLRRVKVKTPSKTKIVYKVRKPSKAKCSKCGKSLSGVPRATKSELASMPKTQKRPERPYGGVLCSKCTRALLKEKANSIKF
jgi:large subunit ribosomal protein L34e